MSQELLELTSLGQSSRINSQVSQTSTENGIVGDRTDDVSTYEQAPNQRSKDESPLIYALHKFAKHDTTFFAFLINVITLVYVMEAVLIAYGGDVVAYYLQLVILAFSTILYFVALYFIELNAPDDDEFLQQSYVSRILAVIEAEGYFELFFLCWGWITILKCPVLAPLRCLRLVRVFFYWEVILEDVLVENADSNSIVKIMATLIREGIPFATFFRQTVREIGTAKSNGSMLILGLFFYVSYIFAVVFWNDLGGMYTTEGETCDTLTHCFMTMLRLAFFDGSGLDYMQTTMDQGYRGRTLLLMLYMIFASFVLLNGLIGIFGNTFGKAFVPDDSIQKLKEAKLKELLASEKRSERARSQLCQSIGKVNEAIEAFEPQRKSETRRSKRLNNRAAVIAAKNKNIHGLTKLLAPVDKARGVFAEKWWIFYPFISLSTLAATMEPILVGFHPEGVAYALQIIVLAVSTFLMIFGVFCLVAEFDDVQADLLLDLDKQEEAVMIQLGLSAKKREKELARLKELRVLAEERPNFIGKVLIMIDGEGWYEVCMLVYGWLTIFFNPGYSALRCFRVLRMAWFFEICAVPKDNKYGAFTGLVAYLVHTSKLLVCYLKKLAGEIPKQGPIVVLVAFFYITYVVSAVFFYHNGPYNVSGSLCSTYPDCAMTLMRLALYDGRGFDYLETVIDSGNWALAVLLILYLCFIAMVLLNGLIGIFGGAFSSGIIFKDSDEESVDDKVHEEAEEEEKDDGTPMDPDDDDNYETFDELKLRKLLNAKHDKLLKLIYEKGVDSIKIPTEISVLSSSALSDKDIMTKPYVTAQPYVEPWEDDEQDMFTVAAAASTATASARAAPSLSTPPPASGAASQKMISLKAPQPFTSDSRRRRR